MCGIFALLNICYSSCNAEEKKAIETQFMKGQSRGPESSVFDCSYLQLTLGFHRLAINGLNTQSNQPIICENIVLICNGEIYNYKQLYNTMNIIPTTDSDCEVIIHLYKKYGIEQTLNMLDGVYAFVLYDYRDNNRLVHVARDPFGVRPLYKLSPNNKTDLFGFASELKCLEYFYNKDNSIYQLTQFEPGTYSTFEQTVSHCTWTQTRINTTYFTPTFPSINFFTATQGEIYHKIYEYVVWAVEKRCETTQREVACLLSGGLDSSLISALVANYFSKKGIQIETYSIGLKNSVDLHYAKLAADYIGTKHTEIIVTEQDMFDAIPEVIKAIESYDTTTVRASIGNYLIGKYISTHSKAKVIFNGDGSDELFGGYLYMNNCPDDIEFDKETRRLLKDIHLFDVLRSDKSISSNGLEPRTPFLDKNLVNYVLSIPPEFRNHCNHIDIGKNINVQISKIILRNSFIYAHRLNSRKKILPETILLRPKEAFSDGVSSPGTSLYTILQNKIAQKLNGEIDELNKTTTEQKQYYSADINTEKEYYKGIFNKLYPNCQHILPYYWMPKYTNATDPSARTLDIYEHFVNSKL